MPIDKSADDKSIIAVNTNGAPTTYEQAAANIARLIQLQNY
jgi:hypothetical protein